MLTVHQLSQELGISVDTLRVWERRYGFPQPQRDRRGHRRYPLDQVEQLRIVRKLQSFGYRPQSLFAMSADERRQLLDSYVAEDDGRVRGFQSLVLSASLDELEQVLRHHLATTTIEHFILHCSAEVLACLDRGWMSGQLTIAREHAISDRVQKILLEILGQQQDTDVASPLILFLTINGERHRLALLMAAVLFSCQGVRCQWLLEDLPMSELPDLVYATACHGVGLSFSSHYSSLQARSDLVTLRRMLPESCHIVAGGKGIAGVYQIPGTTVVDDLGEVETVSRRFFQRK
ncbi:MerR family transcriptional regulator [uncultured Desulfuromonas sp.]|uniref:MerR family transcriptional regulator n=1 Tax=uncultured Desulfuromonas sp. TaxID=181013 RepID=UPI002AAC45C6|nr:MerR family transcriptional regulator [uncultured Desulfuromonas sp.]